MLVCGFCRHQWPIQRIQCPYCGNQDSHGVIFFFSDSEPAYRVYTCKDCKMYIKTVDTRRLSRPFYPPLEAIVTAHLDLKTRGLGFTMPAPELHASDGFVPYGMNSIRDAKHECR